MGRKRCAACGERFTPCRHISNQRYCSRPECQRQRRRRWQREKLRRDADYRANQAAAQRGWCARHPEYWRQYRKNHPQYVERNRAQQRERNPRRGLGATSPSSSGIAKKDVYDDKSIVTSGTYRLIPVSGAGIAKRDVYLVKLQVLSEG